VPSGEVEQESIDPSRPIAWTILNNFGPFLDPFWSHMGPGADSVFFCTGTAFGT
jgi:hypothetical protein